MKVYFENLNGFSVIEEIINVTHNTRLNHLGRESLIFTTKEGKRITTEIEDDDKCNKYLNELFTCDKVTVKEHSYYTIG